MSDHLVTQPYLTCVDCSKKADAKCHECGGPWCRECSEFMKSPVNSHHYPCHTCRNRSDR